MKAKTSKKIVLFLITLIIIFFGITGTANSQDKIIGKVISKNEANNLFGPVISSVTISASQLNSWLTKSENYIMFAIKNNKLFVLGDNRTPIATNGSSISPGEIFHIYSKSKVQELLSSGEGTAIVFEIRQNVFSITKDESTLEFGDNCPPYCW